MGDPDDDLPMGRTWPPGWKKAVQIRKGGMSKGTEDKYWYSPEKKYKFRSLAGVARFLDVLDDFGGDENEERAWKAYRGSL